MAELGRKVGWGGGLDVRRAGPKHGWTFARALLQRSTRGAKERGHQESVVSNKKRQAAVKSTRRSALKIQTSSGELEMQNRHSPFANSYLPI